MQFLIWSNKHHAWWRPSEHGYTDIIEEAGRYARAEAERIVRRSSVDGALVTTRQNPVTGEVYTCFPSVMVLAPECTPAGES